MAINSVFELHPLLARPGVIEKVLSAVKEMKPEILTVRVVEWGGGGGEDGGSMVSSQDKVISEVYLGRQICHLVVCEGLDRVERHETLAQWRAWLVSVGFGSIHLGPNAFKQASMLLAIFVGGVGYKVEEHDGCLMLG
ncbi:hypothetical protein RJ639_013613 [Escallonia herrerae]|uniref:Uncharacterized protein n=1 Tax=Escallonia herrerae TaxID=1293975 RepID=A0AA89APS4_9ASTE|nr:hypothetical protein RJ639_013613 [Escallonia herrerae]